MLRKKTPNHLIIFGLINFLKYKIKSNFQSPKIKGAAT